MGGMGQILTPVLVIRLLGPLGLSIPMTSSFWTHSYTKSPIGRYNPPPASHPPHPSPACLPPYKCNS